MGYPVRAGPAVTMDTIELFCGIGLSAMGSVAAGHRLIHAVDINPAAVRIFNCSGLPPVAVTGSVGSARLPEADLWSAGPVCKAFSPGSTLFGTGGETDERNTFPYLMATVTEYRPPRLLIENTFGMQRFAGYLEELKTGLRALGYTVRFGEIDCYDFGVPQHRRRVVFTCTREPLPAWEIEVPWRRLPGPSTVGQLLAVPPPADDEWPLLLPISEKGMAYWNRDPRHAKKHPPMRADLPASTVVSVYRKGLPYGVVEHAGKLWLTGPRLAARMQGLPDSYKLCGTKTDLLEGIGNGFPPPVVTALLRTAP